MTAEEEATVAKKAEEAKAAEQAAKDAGKAGQAGSAGAEGMVPKAEYDKLQADIANFKRIEDARKTKEKQKQEDLLREQGEFKKLYDDAKAESEAMKARLEKLDGVMKGMLEEEMKTLPEDFDKTLIPSVDPHDQLVWLRKARVVMVKAQPERRGDGTPPARGAPPNSLAGIYTHPTSPKH